ncbi:MAG: hypothetical protein IIV55_04105 [Alistipes sp.]|nr:hypothetical protein [Alistipes sp.]
MKVRFLALAALVLGMVSCQQDVDTVTPVSGEVDFQLSVDAKELATRAGDSDQNAMNSAFGAIDYLQGAAKDDYRQDWNDVDLRYTLEVYDVADDYAGKTPVKDRQVIIVDEYQPVVFDLRLVPNRDYHFVVFADFVAQGEFEKDAANQLLVKGIRHEIGKTLADITVVNEAINDEVADAYFATSDIKVTNSATQDILLKRPYGKVRVIATDLAELNLNVDPKSAVVEYEAFNPNKFNAVTGAIDGEYTVKQYTTTFADGVRSDMGLHYYTADYDAKTVVADNGKTRFSHITLFTDYILAEDTQKPIHFTMTVNDEDGKEIKTTSFYTDIPVQRNYLTTVVGNVLTTATHINVSIDDNFAGYEQLNLWNGKAVEEPVVEGEFYVIYEASQLAWLADQVNNKGQKFSGKTFKLGKNLHLNHELWTPIGATGEFQGTFDGNYNGVDHTIEGIFVSVKGKNFAGLFGKTKSATIKNLTILNSQVYGQYTAAAIVAHGVCARIENCHVEGCEVVSTPYNKDDANNVGGIVGYLSGETVAYVKGCSVKNSRITAYRKVAGIVGSANQTAEVSGNTVEGNVVVADMTAEYNGVKAADAGAIVGYKHAKATVANNTIGANNDVIVLIDTNQERDESYVAKDEVVHVTFKAGEYNFSKELKVNGAIQANLGGKVTLNVNNNTITSGTPANYGIIADGEGNELVINDANFVSYGGGVAAGEGSKVIFNGGKVDITKYTKSSPGRYNFYTSGGEIVINDGVFTFGSTNKTRRAYVCVEGGGKVIINGGTFGKASTRDGYTGIRELDGEVIIYGGTFGFDPKEWLAPDYYTVKDGANWVVKAPVVVNGADEFANAVANAAEGCKIILTDNNNYGTITAGELKNVTIEGGENTVMTFKTDANSKLENVTLKNVDFVYDGTDVNSSIVINAEAEIKNFVVEGCSFVGTGAKAGRGIFGQNTTATITLKNCSFKNLGYPVYTMGGGGYASLVVEGCTFEDIKSWAIMPQYNPFSGDLTVTGNNFINCAQGLVKAGKFTAGHTFTFTNNTITNSAEHPAKNWFAIDTTEGSKVVENNTRDGQPWAPADAEGLK